MEIGVITNPHSRKNRTRPNRAQSLQAIVGNLGEVHATDSIDSIKPILRDFLRKRARYWVADGGDGALHWMLRTGLEILEESEFQGSDYRLPVTLPTKGGTIDFVANNVGIKGRAEQILHSLSQSVEKNLPIEEVEVDSMRIDGISINSQGQTEAFRTYGFASAVGGIGERFFTKYYAEKDPSPKAILKVVGNTIASMPIAFSPLANLPILVPKHLRTYAADMLEPSTVSVSLDGVTLPGDKFTGVHVASMSINLGGVFRFFGKATRPGVMNAIVGSPTPIDILRSLSNMHFGRDLNRPRITDKECKSMIVEARGSELLNPIIDGERYENVRKLTFTPGPRLRIPKIVG